MRVRDAFGRCNICGSARAMADLHAYEGATSKGMVCRPDRWMDDRDENGTVVRKGFVREKKTAEPCFRALTTQAVSPQSSTDYRPSFAPYPVRPGTADWTRLLRASGVRDPRPNSPDGSADDF